MAFFLSMLMFSLAGVPPLAGFFAKFYVFMAAVEAHLYWLAVIGMLTSAVARLLLSAHRQGDLFRRGGAGLRPADRDAARGSRAVVLAMLLFWVYPAPLVEAATAAAKSLF